MHLRKSSLFMPIISVILSPTDLTLSAMAADLPPSFSSYKNALCVPLLRFMLRSTRYVLRAPSENMSNVNFTSSSSHL